MGSILLAESGLLDGRSATTHWTSAKTFAERYPTIKLKADTPIVDDGDLITTAGLMAWSELEKIFQIPLWLRPVPSEYRAAITRTLLDPAESEAEPWVDMPIVASRDAIVTGPAKSEGPEGEGDAPGPAIDADMITREELSYLDVLAGLLGGNPRSLKRFVNTYRLVKTALSDVELASFLQPSTVDGSWTRTTPNAYLPYRICMAQLAVLCTQRNRALRLVRHADAATGNTSLTQWLTEFKTIDADLAERFQSALAKDLRARMSTPLSDGWNVPGVTHSICKDALPNVHRAIPSWQARVLESSSAPIGDWIRVPGAVGFVTK